MLRLKEKLYEYAKATTVAEFQKQMKEMEKLDKNAFNWFAYSHQGSGPSHILIPLPSLVCCLTTYVKASMQ